MNYLFDKGWLELGCIIFSQYYASVWWLANQLSEHHIPDEQIAIYLVSNRSELLKNGQFKRLPRDEIKRMARTGELRLVLGTDAASDGLNLKRIKVNPTQRTPPLPAKSTPTLPWSIACRAVWSITTGRSAKETPGRRPGYRPAIPSPRPYRRLCEGA